MKIRFGMLCCILVGLTGCGSVNTSSPLDTMTRSAGSAMGRVIGESVGQAVVGEYSPQTSAMYSARMMQLAFNSQGVSVSSATRDYEPGDYTEWVVRAGDDDAPENRMRRAFLSREDNGNEWWQVVYHDEANDEETVMEGLFSEGREELLRLRARFPDDEDVQEVPVEEQSYEAPRTLTRESIEGAGEGMEQVSVPAGRFEAQLVRFSSGGAEESWWLTDDVPGGVVQHRVSAANGSGEEAYTRQLSDYGSGAESRF